MEEEKEEKEEKNIEQDEIPIKLEKESNSQEEFDKELEKMLSRRRRDTDNENILTDDEIDELLTAINSCKDVKDLTPEDYERRHKGDGPRIKYFDNRRPDNFNRKQIRFLQALFSRFINKFVEKYSDKFKIHVSSVDQILYESYCNQIPCPSLNCNINIADFDNVKYEFILDLSGLLLVKFDEREKAIDTFMKTKKNNIIYYLLTLFSQTFIRPITTGYNLSKGHVIEWSLSPDLLNTSIPNNNNGILVAFNIKDLVNNEEELMTFFIPSYTTRLILEIFSKDYYKMYPTDKREQNNPFGTNTNHFFINDHMVDLYAEFGTASLSIDNIRTLKSGTILELDQAVGTPILLKTYDKQNNIVAECEIVTIDDKLGLRVL
jgi:flagellar motor switch protein FliM